MCRNSIFTTRGNFFPNFRVSQMPRYVVATLIKCRKPSSSKILILFCLGEKYNSLQDHFCRLDLVVRLKIFQMFLISGHVALLRKLLPVCYWGPLLGEQFTVQKKIENNKCQHSLFCGLNSPEAFKSFAVIFLILTYNFFVVTVFFWPGSKL